MTLLSPLLKVCPWRILSVGFTPALLLEGAWGCVGMLCRHTSVLLQGRCTSVGVESGGFIALGAARAPHQVCILLSLFCTSCMLGHSIWNLVFSVNRISSCHKIEVRQPWHNSFTKVCLQANSAACQLRKPNGYQARPCQQRHVWDEVFSLQKSGLAAVKRCDIDRDREKCYRH